MHIGLVKWFDNEKGFGVLGTPENEEIFLHINSFKKRPKLVEKKTAVAFIKRLDESKKRNSAEYCSLIGEPENWKLIFSHLGKPDLVQIETEKKGVGKYGNSFTKREIHQYSLIGLSLRQFIRDKDKDELVSIIIDYFDRHLDPRYFISYCEQIEKILPRDLTEEEVSFIQEKIYSHFGKNIKGTALYFVWLKKKFRFIGLTENEDHSIPEDVLLKNIELIGRSELQRIQAYNYGQSFFDQYITNRFSRLQDLGLEEIKNLYTVVELLAEQERNYRKSLLDQQFAQKTEENLLLQAANLENITNAYSLNHYIRLIKEIPAELSEEHKGQIVDRINKIIDSKCNSEFRPELWIKGIINSISLEEIKKHFLAKNISGETRKSILIKSDLETQLDLLISYSKSEGPIITFNIIEQFIRSENSLPYTFNFKKAAFDDSQWVNINYYPVLRGYLQYLKDECPEKDRLSLFLAGLLEDIPLAIVLSDTENIDREKCQIIFERYRENELFILKILESKINTDVEVLAWLYDLGSEFLKSKLHFNSFDQKVVEKIEAEHYFKLWQSGKGKIIPVAQIKLKLDDNARNYSDLKIWIEKGLISLEELFNILFSYIQEEESVTDRMIFYKQLNHIDQLIKLNSRYTQNIKALKNEFYNIVLWFLDQVKEFDFEVLKTKFIYFNPDNQVRIVKKLFYLKTKGQFELTVEKLNELSRFDLDLYKTNQLFNPDLSIDISTDVVIKALLYYQEKGRFCPESELFVTVLNNLRSNTSKKFKLGNYFENCKGRKTATFNWKTYGTIRKISFGNDQFYFAIEIPTGEVKNSWSRRGYYDEFIPNEKFNIIKDAVKKIPGAKWNPAEQHWGVPSRQEKEVNDLAKQHRLFFDLPGSNYANNLHLVEFKREERPNGINYCEGRKAKIDHQLHKREFWWCAGQACFEKCETIHGPEQWEDYTLLDICEILGFNTDEENAMGDHISKGHYYHFIAVVNRFNVLLERLYCKTCNHILFPSDFGTSHFAAHTLVRFKCRNEHCDNKDEVYLNHCLNGQCTNVIDSRISKKCENGLWICDTCGSCCSHEMLKRRLANLNLTGGYIHPNLIIQVRDKLGHLEKAEYFCFKCDQFMAETETDVFVCKNCNVKYDTKIYRFQRPHIHLRRSRPMQNNGPTNNNEGEGDDFPF